MVYDIAFREELEKTEELKGDGKYTFFIKEKLNERYNYKIRLKGELSIPYTNRVEEIYPVYLRKLEDSLKKTGQEYALTFGDFNYEYERSCYNMCRANFVLNARYNFSVRYKGTKLNNNFKVSLEVYYGKPKTRYYYEKPDEIYEFSLEQSLDFTTISKEVIFNREVDFVMVKISAINYHGEASVLVPSLTLDGREYINGFSYAPNELLGLKWIGEGFSTSLRPYMEVKLNDEVIFSGRQYERLHRWSGIEFEIPSGLLKGNDKVEISYSKENRYAYRFKEIQIIVLPKQFEILGVSHFQTLNKPFGVLCYFDSDEQIEVSKNNYLEFVGNNKVKKGIQVLRFIPKKTGKDLAFNVNCGGINRSFLIKEINDKKDDGILTGCGDFIYVNQNKKDLYVQLIIFFFPCIL